MDETSASDSAITRSTIAPTRHSPQGRKSRMITRLGSAISRTAVLAALSPRWPIALTSPPLPDNLAAAPTLRQQCRPMKHKILRSQTTGPLTGGIGPQIVRRPSENDRSYNVGADAVSAQHVTIPDWPDPEHRGLIAHYRRAARTDQASRHASPARREKPALSLQLQLRYGRSATWWRRRIVAESEEAGLWPDQSYDATKATRS